MMADRDLRVHSSLSRDGRWRVPLPFESPYRRIRGLFPPRAPRYGERRKAIRDCSGCAVLAHPRRSRWQGSDEMIKAITAVEAGCVPCTEGLDFFPRSRHLNPSLSAAAGMDLHTAKVFYPTKTRLTVERLDQTSILSGLARGAFAIESPLWCLPAQGAGNMGMTRMRVLRMLPDGARAVRVSIQLLIRRIASAEGA